MRDEVAWPRMPTLSISRALSHRYSSKVRAFSHRGRPLGAAQLALHARLRGLGGVPRGALHGLRGLRARSRRVAQRRRHLQARLRRARGGARRLEVRRRAPHRHRRDLVQEGPQVHHGGRRPRPRLPDLGARGHRQGGARAVPRRAHARAEARHSTSTGEFPLPGYPCSCNYIILS